MQSYIHTSTDSTYDTYGYNRIGTYVGLLIYMVDSTYLFFFNSTFCIIPSLFSVRIV